MLIKITNHFNTDGKEYIEWDLWDGPADSSDHAHGYATDLVQAFSKIFEWRERIANDYADLYTDETNSGTTEDIQTDSPGMGSSSPQG